MTACTDRDELRSRLCPSGGEPDWTLARDATSVLAARRSGAGARDLLGARADLLDMDAVGEDLALVQAHWPTAMRGRCWWHCASSSTSA